MGKFLSESARIELKEWHRRERRYADGKAFGHAVIF
jgi:hypothetical protein